MCTKFTLVFTKKLQGSPRDSGSWGEIPALVGGLGNIGNYLKIFMFPGPAERDPS